MNSTSTKTEHTNSFTQTTYFSDMLPHLIQTYFRENRLKMSSLLDNVQLEKVSSESPDNERDTTGRGTENSKEHVHKLSNLLTQRDRIYYERGISFNIMICGQRGVGKTTIIERLFDIDLPLNKKYSKFKEEIELVYNSESSGISIDDTHIKNGITINLRIDEISIFDNNKLDNSFDWGSIITEIERYEIQYYEERQRVYRHNDSGQDKKIHICLYVVEPSQVMSLDIITMKRIGQTINMIPIINKIDIVSDAEELDQRRYELQRLFEIYDITSFQNNNGNADPNPICIHKEDVSILKEIIIDKNMVDLIDNNGVNDSYYRCNIKRDPSNDFWWEESLILRQINLQKKYKKLFESQNKKFQEWIRMLIDKQRRCNETIEQLLNQINVTRTECQGLEDKLITLHESSKYLSNKEITSTTNRNNSSKTLVVTNRVSDSSDNNDGNEYDLEYSGNNYWVNINNHQKRNTNKNKNKNRNPIRNGNHLTENIRVMRY